MGRYMAQSSSLKRPKHPALSPQTSDLKPHSGTLIQIPSSQRSSLPVQTARGLAWWAACPSSSTRGTSRQKMAAFGPSLPLFPTCSEILQSQPSSSRSR